MLVKELIEYLQKLPQDVHVGVLYRAFSEYSLLEEDDMTFIDKPRLDANGGYISPSAASRKERYVYRNGMVMQYDEKTWDKSEKPVFIQMLILPGN